MRSERSRSLAGGFLGGVLGILGFGYGNHQWLQLAAGCLTGVTVVYCYEDLSEAMLSIPPIPARAWMWFYAIVLSALMRVDARSEVWRQFVVKCAAAIGSFGLRLKIGLEHPVNRANVVICLACTVFVVMNIAGMSVLFRLDKRTSPEDSLGIAIMMLLFTAVPAIGQAVIMGKSGWEDGERLRSYFRRWELYSHSKILLFLHTLTALLRQELAWFLAIAGFLGIMFILGFSVGLFVMFPVLTFFLITRGLGRAITKSEGYWVSLATSLLITSCSVYLTQTWLSGWMLWLVALATGCTSAMASYLMVRLLLSKASAWASRSVWNAACDYWIPVAESAERLFDWLMEAGAPIVLTIAPNNPV